MLKTQGLSFAYDQQTRLDFPDIDCESGEQWLLIGQSGCGKTTLLHLLAGLRTPQSGTVTINNTAINKLPTGQLDQFRGKNVGIIFQQSHFVRSLNVLENLLLAQKLAGVKTDENAIREILEHLNIGHKLKSKTSELSIGEQQRVAIARAMVNQPSIIFADEPTSALDDKNTEQVIELLRTQATNANATLLIVTHDNRLKTIFDKRIEL
ncbi:MAG: ABC transporter ATP-binding protein [Bacteroidota bacterium]